MIEGAFQVSSAAGAATAYAEQAIAAAPRAGRA